MNAARQILRKGALIGVGGKTANRKDHVEAKRNSCIELYRVLMMFGICLLHCVSQGDVRCTWLQRLLMPCVCGFVFISGWFGVKFRFRKITGLYIVGLYSAVISTSVAMLCGFVSEWSDAFMLFGRLWKNYWFLNAYVIMTCFAPAVNFVVEHCERRDAVLILSPIVGLVFVWSWGFDIPYVSRFLPHSNVLGAYGGMTLLGIYIVARMCRTYLENVPRRTAIAVALFSCLGVVVLGGEYHSPFAAALAGSCFYLFKDAPPPPLTLQRAMALVSPSLFSVYLIHSRGAVGFKVIRETEKFLYSHMQIGYVYFLSALMVFVVCLMLDFPRRLTLNLIRRVI